MQKKKKKKKIQTNKQSNTKMSAPRVFWNYCKIRLLQLGLKKGLIWGTGTILTTGGIVLDAPGAASRRKGAHVVPLPASEGFKDPFFEDLLDDTEIITTNESVEWLNKSIEPMFPYLEAGLRKFLLENVQPLIRQKVPIVGNQLSLTNISLGEVRPKLGPVHTNLDSENDTVELIVEVDYEGDLTLDLDAGLASACIGSVSLHGELLLGFGPLVNKVNPIGGMEITCLNLPQFEVELTAKGLLLDYFSIPNLYSALKTTVDEVFCALLVKPNNIYVPFTSHGFDITKAKYKEPLGILRLEVLKGESMSKMVSSPKPYIKAQVGASQWFSETKHGNTPVWSGLNDDHVKEFLIYHPKQSMQIDMYNKQEFMVDDHIATASVELKDLRGEQMKIPLRTPTGAPTPGKLMVNAHWYPVGSTVSELGKTKSFLEPSVHPSRQLLSMRVDRASGSNLGQGPHTVRVSVGDKIISTTKGHSPQLPRILAKKDHLIEVARSLHKAEVDPARASEILGISKTDYREFRDQQKAYDSQPLPARNPEVEYKSQVKWGEFVIRNAAEQATAQNPQFEQILHSPINYSEIITIELVGKEVVNGKTTERVVAANTFPLKNGQGPYKIGDCTVHGSIEIKDFLMNKSFSGHATKGETIKTASA